MKLVPKTCIFACSRYYVWTSKDKNKPYQTCLQPNHALQPHVHFKPQRYLDKAGVVELSEVNEEAEREVLISMVRMVSTRIIIILYSTGNSLLLSLLTLDTN